MWKSRYEDRIIPNSRDEVQEIEEQDEPESKEWLTMEATKEEKMEQVHEYGDIEGDVLMNQSIVFKERIPIVEKRWL